MDIDLSQFHQAFFDEAKEHLSTLETLLLALDIDAPGEEALNAIFRAVHSIKGSAATFGFQDLSTTAHQLENLLDRVRQHTLTLTSEMVDLFLATGDVLANLLAAHQNGDAVEREKKNYIVTQLQALAAAHDQSLASSSITAPQAPTVSKSLPLYGIAFTAEAASLNNQGLTHLIEDLRGIGEVTVLSESNNPEVRLTLATDHAQNQFAEWIDFLAQPDSVAIHLLSDDNCSNDDKNRQTATLQDDPDGAFGFFTDNATNDTSDISGTSDTHNADQPQNAATLQDDPGGAFGFFTDIATNGTSGTNNSNNANPPQPAAALQDDPDGAFGFFSANTASATGSTRYTSHASTARNTGGTNNTNPPQPAAALQDDPDGAFGFFSASHIQANNGSAQHGEQAAGDGEGVSYGFFVPVPIQNPSRPTRTAPPPVQQSHATGSVDSSIRVNTQKVDQLINMTGELVITQAMLMQSLHELGDNVPEKLLSGLAQLERNSRSLQEAVMSIRMMPLSMVFMRFKRLVHDLCTKLGKRAELKLEGAETEIDKGMIEKLTDPLTHLIRNSLDHGIEMPAERRAKGKDETGILRLRAKHQGGQVVIEVSDDGAGINREKILLKAHERGLAVRDDASDREVYMLVCEPGFSTAEEVTEVSGRGVGMDVVQRNLQALSGYLDIESAPNLGTCMSVHLPLTLAILDGISVLVGEQTYILPIASIIESLQVSAADIRTMGHERGWLVQVRGEYFPLIALHERFDVHSQHEEAGIDKTTLFSRGIMVVVAAGKNRAALFVDALVGQHQVVIKSLENNYHPVAGISAATILGNGRVAFILDVAALIMSDTTHGTKAP